MDTVNFDWYRVFYHVARLGSISQAARELNVSQSAVSQMIRQLEDALDISLFVRNAKGVRLSPDAEPIYTYISQAYKFIETAERRIRDQRQLNFGEVRIGAGDTLSRHLLIPHLKEFHHQYPDIHIRVINRTSEQIVQLLREGRIDLGIVHLPIDESSLSVRWLLDLHDCFMTGQRPSWAERPLHVRDLSSLPLILLEKGSVTRDRIDQYFKLNHVNISPEVELGSIDLIIAFAKIGMGVGCVAREFIANEIARGELVEVPVLPAIPARSVALVSHAQIPLSKAAEAFSSQLTLGLAKSAEQRI